MVQAFLKYDATYATLYSDLWTYAEWAKLQGITGRHTSIDLVAKTSNSYGYHTIWKIKNQISSDWQSIHTLQNRANPPSAKEQIIPPQHLLFQGEF